MVFYSGAKVTADIIDEIADALIASSVNWVEGDATWDTTDRSTGSDNAKRCLKYTGDAADIWITLQVINSDGKRFYEAGDDYYGKGIRVTFVASWDSTNHTWGGTPMHTFIPFESDSNDSSPNCNLETEIVNYWTWVDATGFVVMGKPEPISANNRQSSFIIVTEHMGTKEYSDGYSNFYCYWAGNYIPMEMDTTTNLTSGFVPYRYTRPFAFQNTDDGYQFWNGSKHAFKSAGNGKVYFTKPVMCNTSDNKTPIYQSELFFVCSPSVGLVDGDVIAVDGDTTKYLVKMISSPDSAGTINYAMKYVA